MTNIAIAISLLCAGMDTGEWLVSKWLVVIAIAVYFLCRIIWAIDKLMAVAVGYALLNGLFFAMSPYGYPQFMDVGSRDVLAHHGMRAMIYLFALVIATVNFERIRGVYQSFWWMGIVASMWLIAGSGFDWYLKGPSFNPSMSATLVALLIPFMVARFEGWRKWAMIALPVVAICMSGSAIGYVAAFAGLVAHFIVANRQRDGVVYATVGVVGILAGLTIYMHGASFFEFNGRMENWTAALGYLFEHPDRVLFGFGLGSYYPFSVHIQTITGSSRFMVTAHNDWIQCLFELGWIGAFLWSIVYARALWYGRRETFTFSFFVILGVSAFGNFPHHMGLESFIIACVYRATTKTRTIITKI